MTRRFIRLFLVIAARKSAISILCFFTNWSIGAFGHIPNQMLLTFSLLNLNPRETEDTVIKIPDLMLLNKDADRKFELGGGFTTDSRFHP